MKERINQYIKELQNAITVAGLNYEIWWVYKEKESRARFVDTLNDYPLFFQTSLHAHFVAMVIALYRLFETRRDSVNIPRLVKMIKDQSSVSEKDIQKIEKDISRIKPLWVKVSILRNKLFGHKSNALDDEEIWNEVEVTPNEFRDLIDESKKILNHLTLLWDRRSHAFNLSSKEDTIRLLEDLINLKETRLKHWA